MRDERGPRPEATEFIEVVELPLGEALEMVSEGGITDAATVLGFLGSAHLSFRRWVTLGATEDRGAGRLRGHQRRRPAEPDPGNTGAGRFGVSFGASPQRRKEDAR